MTLTFWDAALRGGALALFALLAFLFARDWERALTARLGVAVTIGACCYVALVALDSGGPMSPWRLPLHLMSLATPALFWLFASSWFDDAFRLRRWHLAMVALVVFVGFLANYLYWSMGSQLFAIAIAWRLLSMILVGAAVVAAVRGRADDLVDARRRARLALALVTSLVILLVIVGELPLHDWPPPVEWRVVNALGLFLLAGVLAVVLLGWRDPALLAAPARVIVASRPEADDSALLARLDADMRHERLYRQDGLTIAAVAARLGVPDYRLRRAINTGLGARNFNAYLNGFRLDEAEAALADRDQRGVPILTIAMDAGFGSLAPFNRAFRERHDCTPTEYRARH